MPTASAQTSTYKPAFRVEDKRLKDASERILHLRRSSSKAMLDLISEIAVLRQDDNIDAISFLLRCGVSAEEIHNLEAIARVLEDDREVVYKNCLQFHTLTALSKVGRETRTEVLKRIDAGEVLDARAIRSAHRIQRARCRSEAENAYLAHRTLLRKRLQKQKFEAEKEFTERANCLHLAMAKYLELRNKALQKCRVYRSEASIKKVYRASLRQRREVKESAADLLVRFEKLFGTEFATPQDWLFLDEENLPTRRLSEAYYALKLLATGTFSDLPHHDTEFYEWSSFSSIGILAGKPAFNRYTPSVIKTDAAPVTQLRRKLRAVTAGNDASGIQLGMEAATFEMAGHLGIETPLDPEKVLGRMKNADVFSGIVPIRNAKHAIKAKEIQVFDHMKNAMVKISPRSFFLECGSSLLSPFNRGFLQKQKAEFARLGYRTSEFHLNSRDFGLCQDRERAYIVGFKHTLASDFQMQPIALDLAAETEALIKAAVTADFSRASDVSAEENSALTERADRAVQNFRERSRLLAPDLDKLIYRPRERLPDELRKRPLTVKQLEKRKNQSTLPSIAKPYVDALQEAGFGIEFQHVASAQISHSLPLSVSVLKVLQGLPSDWMPSERMEPVREICQTMPPVIARALAQSLHRTITGETIDLESAAKLPLARPRRRSSSFRVGLMQSVQPKHFIAEHWKAEWLRQH